MSVPARLQALHPELTRWRHELHQHPQTAFEETFASEFIASKLQAWGIETHRGLAKTGVVGVIRGKQTGDARLRNIGLRPGPGPWCWGSPSCWRWPRPPPGGARAPPRG